MPYHTQRPTHTSSREGKGEDTNRKEKATTAKEG